MNYELKKSPVRFDEDSHTYWLGSRQLKGITSTLIRRAFPDKYADVDPETLANAARKGKELHSAIEFHDNFQTDAAEAEDQRVAAYERIKQENGLTVVANEYLVSDEQHYASSIDIVLANQQGEICLADIKTTWTLDRTSAALQLSVYKQFFEQQNPNLKVSRLYVIWLPNRDHTIAEIHQLSPVAPEAVEALIQADLQDQPFDIATTYGNLPATLHSVEDEIIRIEEQVKQCKTRQDELKKGLYDLMAEHDVKSFTGQKIRLTRVLPTTSETFDTKRFSEEHPELYNQYTKTSQRAGSLKITIINQ